MWLAGYAWATGVAGASLVLPKTGLEPADIAVVVNEDDPNSVRVGEYYRDQRGIPAENLIRVRFPAQGINLRYDRFKAVKELVDRKTPSGVQAYALAWSKPYRVECMSITSAFAFGFDPAYCSKTCGPTKASEYFNSASTAPYSDYQVRPAMLLAGTSVKDVKGLIARGIASDHTYPTGTGYLLSTSDKNRSVRAALFDDTLRALGGALHLQQLQADSIKDKQDVMFYFTGLAFVPDLPTLKFLPGAVADHLTSVGGDLTGSSQMTSLRWLEAGATGSYGTVVEPCNHLRKFPHPGIVMWRYAEGNSLIEAYWKSVVWPGEGLFIGEPLAKPYAPQKLAEDEHQASLRWFVPEPRVLRLETSASPMGPFRVLRSYPLKAGLNELRVAMPDAAAFYRIGY